MSLGTTASDPFGEETSGSTSFRLLATDLISEAFDYLEMGVDGEELSAEMFNRGFRTLNMMIATWQAQGIHLWSYSEGILFLSGNKPSYIIEQSNATNSYYQTTLVDDAVQGSSSFVLDPSLSTYNVQQSISPDVDWYVGIMTNDNELFWAFVESYDDVTGVLQIKDSEGDPAFIDADANNGCEVFFYQSFIRPLERVLNIRRTDNLINDTPINQISREEYFNLPLKTSQGIPAEAYFDRALPQGVMYLWPVPQNSRTLVRFLYERKIEDFVNVDDCPDFPKYWIEALVFGLARRLAIKYRVTPAVKQYVDIMSEETLNEALSFDNEVTDLSISLNRGA